MQTANQNYNLQDLFMEEETGSKKIQSTLGYHFRNVKLLAQAFTRKSYTEENREVANNEVLEFYGDKALDFVVMKKMSTYFGEVRKDGVYSHTQDEGELTEIKKKLVCKGTLASRIRTLGLERYLIMGIGDQQQQVWMQDSVQEDLFEAILGAVAIDSDWNIAVLEKAVDRMLNIDFYFNNGFDGDVDYYDLLQQWHQKKFGTLPECEFAEYKYTGWPFLLRVPRVGEECRIRIASSGTFRGQAESRAAARAIAAKAAYQYLETHNLLISLVDEVGTPDLERAINQLQELNQKGYIDEPKYTFMESHDENGNAIWECICSVKGLDFKAYAKHSSKKQAKKEAAYRIVYLYLGEAMPDEA